MTKTDIGFYRGLKEKRDPDVHIGFFITTDTGELLLGDQSLGQTILDWEINDGVLTLKLNTGRNIEITFPEATEVAKGLLSAEDKAQLDALATNLQSKVDKEDGKSLVDDTEIEKLAGLPSSEDLDDAIADAKKAGEDAQSNLESHEQDTDNPHEVTKDQVGLGSVTNDAQVKRSEMGQPSGVATLDENGKVPSNQLPSYVDDIVDVYATYSKSDTGELSNIVLYLDEGETKLVSGESGKIYQNIKSGEPSYQFRWTGSVFAQTGASSLIIGEVTGTAYDGAKGKSTADSLAKIKATSLSHIKDSDAISTTVDKVSINYDCYEGEQYGSAGTSHSADIPSATTTSAGVMSAADKAKLDGIEEGAEANVVTSVVGKTGDVTLDKTDVGLNNVTNDAQVKRSEMGAASGVATLDSDSKVEQNIDASKIVSGTISVDRLPKGALERLTIVANATARKALTTDDVQNGDTVKEASTGLMYYVKDDTKLAQDAGWEVYTAGSATSVPWSGVTSKPSTLSGYGITDAVDQDTLDNYYTKEEIDELTTSKFTVSGETLIVSDLAGVSVINGVLKL